MTPVAAIGTTPEPYKNRIARSNAGRDLSPMLAINSNPNSVIPGTR
jgi:hypothetical protein